MYGFRRRGGIPGETPNVLWKQQTMAITEGGRVRIDPQVPESLVPLRSTSDVMPPEGHSSGPRAARDVNLVPPVNGVSAGVFCSQKDGEGNSLFLKDRQLPLHASITIIAVLRMARFPSGRLGPSIASGVTNV